MQRYFVDIINSCVIFTSQDIFHITKVMRCKIGDNVEIINNGKCYLFEITSINPFMGKIQTEIDTNPELVVNTTLMFCLAKKDKIEFVIQKATELGVSKIVLIKSARSILKMDEQDFKKKHERFTLIAKEASEQSKRLIIPEILGPYDITNIPCSVLSEINYVAYEKNNGKSFIKDDLINKKSVSILVGPEGGLEEKEIVSLSNQGFIPISLGKRILRTETAAISSLSMLNYILEYENDL